MIIVILWIILLLILSLIQMTHMILKTINMTTTRKGNAFSFSLNGRHIYVITC